MSDDRNPAEPSPVSKDEWKEMIDKSGELAIQVCKFVDSQSDNITIRFLALKLAVKFEREMMIDQGVDGMKLDHDLGVLERKLATMITVASRRPAGADGGQVNYTGMKYINETEPKDRS